MTQKITNEQILKTAMRQSAIDMNCNEIDFLLGKNKVVISKKNANARRYLKLPFAANLVSYGNNIVASCSSELCAIVEEYISSFVWYHALKHRTCTCFPKNCARSDSTCALWQNTGCPT